MRKIVVLESLPEIDSVQDHAKLIVGQFPAGFDSVRPRERSSLEALGPQTEAVAVPVQCSEDLEPRPAEQEKISAHRLESHEFMDDSR